MKVINPITWTTILGDDPFRLELNEVALVSRRGDESYVKALSFEVRAVYPGEWFTVAKMGRREAQILYDSVRLGRSSIFERKPPNPNDQIRKYFGR